MEDSKKIVLSFDLDYTLINNKKGIVNSFNYAMRKFNLPKVKKSIIEKMIGLPLNEMFTRFTDLNPSKLSSTFREYYNAKGIYQSILLPGVKTRLKEFKNSNFILGVVTSKKQDIALKILRYLGIESYFDYVIGETDKIKSKTDPLLFKTLTESYPGYNFIIIGDHPKDALLAKELNSPFIGVLTGFYNSNQLKEARANNSQTVIIKKLKFLTVDMVNSIRN